MDNFGSLFRIIGCKMGKNGLAIHGNQVAG